MIRAGRRRGVASNCSDHHLKKGGGGARSRVALDADNLELSHFLIAGSVRRPPTLTIASP